MKYKLHDYEDMRELFLKNKNKWYSGNYLKRYYDISTIKLQSIIHDMRIDRISIIAGGSKGYKYSTDREEIMTSGLSLVRRGKSVILSGEGLMDSIKYSQDEINKLNALDAMGE